MLKAAATGTRWGCAEIGSQAERSRLPDESNVAAHSCFGWLPESCSHLCRRGAPERPMAATMVQRTMAEMKARDLSECEQRNRSVTGRTLRQILSLSNTHSPRPLRFA